jgi:hypothetical protein
MSQSILTMIKTSVGPARQEHQHQAYCTENIWLKGYQAEDSTAEKEHWAWHHILLEAKSGLCGAATQKPTKEMFPPAMRATDKPRKGPWSHAHLSESLRHLLSLPKVLTEIAVIFTVRAVVVGVAESALLWMKGQTIGKCFSFLLSQGRLAFLHTFLRLKCYIFL